MPYVLRAIGLLGVVYVASLYFKDRLFGNNLNNYTGTLETIEKWNQLLNLYLFLFIYN